MKIQEVPIKGLDNKPAKFKKLQYPTPVHAHVQRCYYCAVLCGLRGQGKTWACCKMLANQEASGFIDPVSGNKVEIRHILFTSTLSGNPIWGTLKHLHPDDIHEEYSDELLESVLEDIKKEKLYTEVYKNYTKAYAKFIKMSEEEFRRWDDKEAIILLQNYNYSDPKYIKKPKYPFGCVTNIILDDLLASPAFDRNRKNTVLKLTLNGRHYGANLFILAQHLKSIQRPIRENAEVIVLFKFKSRKMIEDDLYELVGNLCTIDEFFVIYEYATGGDNNALVIDLKEPDPRNRFKKNFDKIIRLTSNGATEDEIA